MKPRIKMRQMPGDVCKGVKIIMMEGKTGEPEREKSFRKMVRMRERAVLKERAREELEPRSEG